MRSFLFKPRFSIAVLIVIDLIWTHLNHYRSTPLWYVFLAVSVALFLFSMTMEIKQEEAEKAS